MTPESSHIQEQALIHDRLIQIPQAVNRLFKVHFSGTEVKGYKVDQAAIMGGIAGLCNEAIDLGFEPHFCPDGVVFLPGAKE